MKYNLSRQPGSYEFEREHFGFNVNSKVYNAREYSSITDCFRVIDIKKKDKYIEALDVIENGKMHSDKDDKYFHKCANYMVDAPLYFDTTISLYKHNQNYIHLMTKLVIRKMIIAYLKKEYDVGVVEKLTNEKQFKTTFVIKNVDAFKNLHDYFYDWYVNKTCSYEDFLNKNISKIGKTNYLMSSTDKYKIDPNHPIEFSNIADGLDCADIYTAYLNLFNRIKQIYQQIEWQEQEHNKKFKAAVIWTV